MNLQSVSTAAMDIPDDSLMEYKNGSLVGKEMIRKAFEQHNFNHLTEIITSKDRAVIKAQRELEVNTMPDGFRKILLPIENFTKDNLFFISEAKPNAKCPSHSHSIDEGFRVIMAGSIKLNNGIELECKDWFYVPVNCEYNFIAGKNGATIFHAYSSVKQAD